MVDFVKCSMCKTSNSSLSQQLPRMYPRVLMVQHPGIFWFSALNIVIFIGFVKPI